MKKSVVLVLLVLLSTAVFAFGFSDFTQWFSDDDGLKIVAAHAEPAKVRVGDTLTLFVVVEDLAGIQDAYVTIAHDKGADRVQLNLDNQSGFSYFYTGKWLVHDTSEKWYVALVEVVDVNGLRSTRDVVFYDPVTPNPGHSANEVGGGTFFGGEPYIFPANVTVQGNLTVGNATTTITGAGIIFADNTTQTAAADVFGVFGDGSDGNVTIGGTTALTRDMYYDNLIVTGTLQPSGFRVFVRNNLTLSGAITVAGAAGSVVSVCTPGSGGSASPSGTLGGGGAGGTGGDCVTFTGVSGGVSGSSVGGSGTAGGDASGGAGGTATAPTTGAQIRALPFAVLMSDFPSATRLTGGAGGGGGGGDGLCGAGAGGGAGGGVMMIAARRISNAGTITAAGGNGASASGNGCGAGGSGGGGAVVLVYGSYFGSGTISVAGGSGQLGGGGCGDCGSSATGSAGTVVRLQIAG